MSTPEIKSVFYKLPHSLQEEVKSAAKAEGKLVSAKAAELLRKGLAAENSNPPKKG